MNDNEKNMNEDIKELNEEIKKYNEMISEDYEEAKPELEPENEEETKPVLEQELEKPINKTRKINKKTVIIISIIVMIFLLVTLTYGANRLNNSSDNNIKTPNEYKEEEKIIAGILEETKDDDETKKIIEEVKQQEEEKKENINNSKNYEKYEKLSEEEKKKSEIIPDKENKEIDLIDSIKEEIDILNNLPTKYNLKDDLKLIVDNQGEYGLCWAFATLESMETNYQLKNKKEINLSEITIDYLTSNELFGYREAHYAGGTFLDVTKNGNIKGIKKEEKNEYRDWNEKEILSLLDGKDNYYITDYVSFPSIYKTYGKADISDEELQEFRKLVKSHIIQYGSIYAVVDGNIPFSFNEYYSDQALPSHAVSIVGWDDNYPKENFTDLNMCDPENYNSAHPKHDGAYIIKNSWGPKSGDKGYYYVSYDDQLIESELKGVLSVDTNKKYYINELPDYLKKLIKDDYYYIIKRNTKGEYVFPQVFKDITSIGITQKDNINEEDFNKIIDYLPNLSMVYLEDLNIKNISALAKLNNLQILSIKNIKTIQDFSVIGEIKTLKNIELNNNDISDISFISSLENLESVNFSNNKITDISPLANLKLSSIILDNNNIKDISILTHKDNLSYLSISGNQGIEGYNKYSNLYHLDISNCELSEIDNLHFNNHKYISLVFNNNHLTKLPNIENVAQCDPDDPYNNFTIDAENNNINNITNLSKYYIYNLNLNNNKFTDLSQLENYYFESLNLSDNNITDTSNFNNKNIKSFNLSNNKEIVISKELNTINNLMLDNCNVESIKELSMLDNVEELHLNNNQISSLEGLEKLDNLNYLSLDNNQIISLKTTPKSNLNSISLENNKIEDTSGIEKLEQLKTLKLSNNKLEQISSLSKLNELEFLYLDNIGTIDVSSLSSNEGELSISLKENNIKGELKGDWQIVNIECSTIEDLDINDASFNYLTAEDIKGNITIDKILSNIIKKGNDTYSTIVLDDNISIKQDTIKEIINKNINITLLGGNIPIKLDYNDNQYKLDEKEFRKLLINNFTSNKIVNGYINDNFTGIIPINNNEDIIINMLSFKNNFTIRSKMIVSSNNK